MGNGLWKPFLNYWKVRCLFICWNFKVGEGIVFSVVLLILRFMFSLNKIERFYVKLLLATNNCILFGKVKTLCLFVLVEWFYVKQLQFMQPITASCSKKAEYVCNFVLAYYNAQVIKMLSRSGFMCPFRPFFGTFSLFFEVPT